MAIKKNQRNEWNQPENLKANPGIYNNLLYLIKILNLWENNEVINK